MFAYIRGSLVETGNDHLILENQGIGYLIYTPDPVIDALPAAGEQIRVYTYMYVREDQLALYGFLTRDDLEIFKLLIGISGIGPKGALGILSTISSNQLRMAVLSGDAKAIAKAPGIGPKTAQKLIIELKDKLKLADTFEVLESEMADSAVFNDNSEKEALLALVSLGYSEAEAFRAMQRVKRTENMDSETLLKLALKQMLTL